MNRAQRRLRPAQILVMSFGAAITTGTLLLWLPLASRGEPLRFLDALFTATSAVCVTGLTVVDTGSHFTPFGQGVLLILIQLGGLGIMTLGTFFVAALGGRVGWRGRDLISHTLSPDPRSDLWALLKGVLGLTLTLEGIGALLLFVRFVSHMHLLQALWHAVFHSVSAFCNAGFSLNADSFERYVGDYLVNGTLMALIVTGGLGFVVMLELRNRASRLLRKEGRSSAKLPFSLHSRLTLTFTGVIIGIAFLLFLVLEWSNTLTGMPVQSKLVASLFQAVTPRTAGFNTVPIGATSNATLFLLILVMFIGGAPGSCAGGVKVSTFGVLFSLAVNRAKGNTDTVIFERRVSERTVSEALSIITLAVAVVVVFTFLLVAAQVGTVSFGDTRGEFIRLFFEAVSAFGTVGLSTGSTTGLTDVGQLLVTLLMFIGRLGPLTVAVAVAQRQRRPLYRYVEEDVMVG